MLESRGRNLDRDRPSRRVSDMIEVIFYWGATTGGIVVVGLSTALAILEPRDRREAIPLVIVGIIMVAFGIAALKGWL